MTKSSLIGHFSAKSMFFKCMIKSFFNNFFPRLLSIKMSMFLSSFKENRGWSVVEQTLFLSVILLQNIRHGILSKLSYYSIILQVIWILQNSFRIFEKFILDCLWIYSDWKYSLVIFTYFQSKSFALQKSSSLSLSNDSSFNLSIKVK